MKKFPNALKEVDKIQDVELYMKARDIVRIANLAVQKAKEENKKYGILECFVKNGKLYYIQNDGRITTQEK